jgi:hypothetical protein
MAIKKHLRRLTRGLQVVPAVAADVTTKNAWIYQLTVANTHSATVTLLVQNKETSAKTLVPTVSLGGNSLTIMSWPEGIYMSGGISWVASLADKLHADIDAYEAAE